MPVLNRARAKPETSQGIADAGGGCFVGPSAGHLRRAVVQDALHERAGGQHDRPGAVLAAAGGADAGDARPAAGRGGFDDEVLDGLLAERQAGLLLADAADFLVVGRLVGLGPGAVHGGPFSPVEHPELDAGPVDGPAHRPAQGVDLADDLPLGDAADRRVAAHPGDRIQPAGQKRGPSPQPRRRQRRLDAGMSAADDQDVEVTGRWHVRFVQHDSVRFTTEDSEEHGGVEDGVETSFRVRER